MALTPRQQRFVQEYLIDLNATAAYKRAGYSPTGADACAARLLGNASVQAAIQASQAQRAQQADLSADRVIKEYLALGFNDLRSIFDYQDGSLKLKPLAEWPESVGRSLSGLKVKRQVEGSGDAAREVEIIELKLWSKTDALEKLGKHLNLFPDRHEHSGKDGAPIPIRLIEFAGSEDDAVTGGGNP